jgi:hydroxymethylpyrimidine pyrophosphatase-like HAD family hydrolase
MAAFSGKKQKHLVFDIDDTLLFDNGRSAPNLQIIEFLTDMKASGFQIHLVTARGKSTESMTKLELNRSAIP